MGASESADCRHGIARFAGLWLAALAGAVAQADELLRSTDSLLDNRDTECGGGSGNKDFGRYRHDLSGLDGKILPADESRNHGGLIWKQTTIWIFRFLDDKSCQGSGQPGPAAATRQPGLLKKI